MSFIKFLNGSKFEYLPGVILGNRLVKWNPEKNTSKFLLQLNQRITLPHITHSQILGEILQRGLSIKYGEFAIGFGRDNDTCVRFRKSQFIVLFNKSEHTIIGIRKSLNNLRCNRTKLVMENIEDEEKLFKELNVKGYSINEPEDGLLMIINEDDKLEVTNVCRVCVEVDL